VFERTRHRLTRCAALLLVTLLSGGCVPRGPGGGRIERVWGQAGAERGQLQKPRAIAIDQNDRLFIVDMTARIQVYDRDGNYLYGWRTPEHVNGRPIGLTFDHNGNLMVADTHYHRLLFYQPDGILLQEKTIGGTYGREPGQFAFVTDAVQDSQGNYFISEYGDNDRIQKYSPAGKQVLHFGQHGDQPGQFNRASNLAIDPQDWLWVADACNHRIQVFDTRQDPPRLVLLWGQAGSEPGQLKYPYDLLLDEDGYVYVCEFGNHRVQKFTRDGQFVSMCGGPGKEPGLFAQPWGFARDSRGALHVLDSYNHRVQRVRL
jgi:sugar lactone lactonase YvrE